MLLPLSMETLQLLLDFYFPLLSLSFCVGKYIFEVANLFFNCLVTFTNFVVGPLALWQLTFLRLFNNSVFNNVMVSIKLVADESVDGFDILNSLVEKLFASRNWVI